MALSRVQINAKSEAKRGIKAKTYKLHQDTVNLIEYISQQTGISQSKLITEAAQLLAEKYQVQTP